MTLRLKSAGLGVTADVIRFQADSGTMQGVRLFVVNNASSPAKTQMNDHNFEFYLPAGAKVEQVQARAPNGQPIRAEAVPSGEKNRYAIAFPLRPGETQFQLEFTLPYSGEIKIDPKPLYPAQHFVVVLPQDDAVQGRESVRASNAMHDPSQGDSNVEVAQETKPGQVLSLHPEGQGVITDSPGDTASGAAQQPDQQQAQQQQRTIATSADKWQSAWRRTRRPHRCTRSSPEISLAHPRWIRHAACHRRMGGHETATVTAASSSAVTSSSAAKPVAAASDYGAVLRPTEPSPATTDAHCPAAKSRCCWKR